MPRSYSTKMRLERLGDAPEPQPGDRAAAPGELALVQSFANSRWNLINEHEERLSSPEALAEWLKDRGLVDADVRLDDSDLARAVEVREGLRELMFVNNGASPDAEAVRRLNTHLAGATVAPSLEPRQPPVFRPVGGGLDGALGVLAAITAAAQIDGCWRRMKACRGAHCGWVFYDYSRNASGNWCSMSVCGQRTKARDYRRRQREA